MLAGLLKMSGFLILKLIYGKNIKKIEEIESALSIALSIGFVFWLISLLILCAGIAANDTWLCIAIVVGYPLILIIWCILVRLNKNKD